MFILPVIFGIVVSGALGATVPAENDAKPRQLQLASTESNLNPVYPGGSQGKSPLSSPQYFYPTYPEYSPETGYAVQTGYDGYLIPAAPPRHVPTSWGTTILSTIVPVTSYALSYGAKAGIYLWNLFLLLVIGGIFTTSICTFTPFCTITFLGLGLTKNQVREQVSELARTYITPESMNAATLLVKRAIDKYAELQRQQREAEEKANVEKKEARRRRRR